MGNDTDLRLVHPPPRENRVAVPSEVLGTLIFILTEIMLFAGFISAFVISKTSAAAWPPPDQPRLPIEETLLNTAALLASGAILYVAGTRFAAQRSQARTLLMVAAGLGAFFVVFQGFEWVQLLSDGLTLTSSTYGGFFYLIVGAHALHAVGGVAVLAWMVLRMRADTLTASTFWAGRLFWYFVVLLWPFLYWQVYL